MWLNILWDYMESKCIAALKVVFTDKPAYLHLNWCIMIILNNQIHSQNVPPDTFKCRSKILISFACSVQFSSVAQSCLTLCDLMNRSTPGLPVHHQLPEFTQTHVHRVSDAIQPSHPLSSPSPPAPNSSQNQSLFQRVNSSYEVAKVLEFQL